MGKPNNPVLAMSAGCIAGEFLWCKVLGAKFYPFERSNTHFWTDLDHFAHFRRHRGNLCVAYGVHQGILYFFPAFFWHISYSVLHFESLLISFMYRLPLLDTTSTPT
jgi:hypothetical protein